MGSDDTTTAGGGGGGRGRKWRRRLAAGGKLSEENKDGEKTVEWTKKSGQCRLDEKTSQHTGHRGKHTLHIVELTLATLS